jgi:predicted TIM-barrel fold metal-dependent hydrolase
MIIDSHVHIARQFTGFWKPLHYGQTEDEGTVHQALAPAFEPVASPPEILLGYMDQAGVDKAVMVQHHLYGDQNATVLDTLKRWPDRFFGFAYLGAMDRLDAADQLERLLERGMTGLKVELATTRRLRADFRFDGEREWRLWERLDQLRRPLIVDVNGCTEQDTTAVARMATELEHLRMVICHLGGAPGPRWQANALVARNPRVYVDIASLQNNFGSEHEYPFPLTQDLVHWALDNLGSDKILWGTDYPGALNWGTYRQLVDMVRRHCDFLSAAQKAQVLGGNAQRFLTEG